MRLRSFSLAALAAVSAMVVVSCSGEHVTAPSGFAPRFGPVGALTSVRIAEFHYDNAGTDAGEAIEISGPAGFDVSGWQIVLYNGAAASRATYDIKTLSGLIPASGTCSGRGVLVQTYPVNGIQNGNPDGIALVDNTGAVIQFFSYGGVFVAANGPAAGLTSTDFGIAESGTTPVGHSLQLDAAGDWAAAAHTFDGCNDGGGVVAPVVASVTVTTLTPVINQGNTATFTATAFDAASQPIAGVSFTWTSSNGAAATVANGIATGVAPGDADIIATAPNGVAGQAALHVDPPVTPGFPSTRFSEIHYDNVGTDADEFIEIEGNVGADLTGWTIQLYNGNGGVVYDTKLLSGTIAACSSGATRGVMVVNYPVNGIQNGSPDGMALVDAGGAVVEFLSYEGPFAATAGPAAGTTATDIGVSQTNAPIGQTLQRDGSNVWSALTGSKDACNGIAPPPPGNSVQLVMNNPRQIPVGFIKPAFPTVRDGSNQVITPTPLITWTSTDNSIATVDANGYVAALAVGTVTIRATEPDGAFAEITVDILPTTVPTGAQYHNNTMFGIPADADPLDDLLLSRPQYAFSYNPNRGGPNWVAANINVTTFGAAPRCDCFSPDHALLPAGVYQVVDFDYRNSGYDRGHMTQSEPRTDTYQENATTFYLTNILPQAGENNQGPWSQLENHLNDLVRLSGKEVWVYTGGEYEATPPTLKNEGKVQVPTWTWKVAVILNAGQTLADIHTTADLQVIAVRMPNLTTPGVPGSAVGIRNVPWQTFETTVDDIESRVGYDLLHLLPDAVELLVESKDQAPVAVAGGPYSGSEGNAIAFDGSASSDPDAGQMLTHAWDFGDGSTGTGATPSHTYADNGSYTATLTVTDPIGATATASVVVTVANVPPSASLTVPASVVEGSSFDISLGSVADPSPVDAASLQFAFDCGDGAGYGAPGTSASATCATSDNGTRAVLARVIDKDGGATEYGASVVVTNAAPVIGALTVPGGPLLAGTPVTATVSFGDPGSDTWQTLVSWGDGTTSMVGGGAVVTASHSYATPGLYTVTATVTDDDGGADSRSAATYTVVYDPEAGRITGAGWFQDAGGKAAGAWEARYHRGDARGVIGFQDGARAVQFISVRLDWLVVAGNTAVVRGRGTILRRPGTFQYLMVVRDAGRGGRGDGVRFKILDAAGTVVYDNQPGEPDDSGAVTNLGGGNATIHR